MVNQKIAIQLLCESGDAEKFITLCENEGLKHDSSSSFGLIQTEFNGQVRLELRKLSDPKLGAVFVDFISGKMAHRRKFGGGRGEAIAKAVGIKKDYLPNVIDATAGLGRDAFVLAAIGCQIKLVERHPVVRLLLQDGLQRAYADQEIGEMMKKI